MILNFPQNRVKHSPQIRIDFDFVIFVYLGALKIFKYERIFDKEFERLYFVISGKGHRIFEYEVSDKLVKLIVFYLYCEY